MGVIRKYARPVFYCVPWLLVRLPKINKMAKKPWLYTYEYRWNYACKIFDRISKGFRVEFRINGLEKINDKKTLIVSNHQSFYDPFFTSQFGFPVCWVAKQEIAKFPVVGKVAKFIDVVFMDRDDLRGAAKVIRSASNKIEYGQAMWINPEGTRTKNEGHAMNGFKAGTFKTAFNTKCAITMIAINGTYNVFDKKYHGKKIYVDISVIGQLAYKDYKDMNTQELAKYTHDIVNDRFLEIKKRQEDTEIKVGKKNEKVKK